MISSIMGCTQYTQLVHSLLSHLSPIVTQLFCVARWDNWEWPRAVATSLLGLEKPVVEMLTPIDLKKSFEDVSVVWWNSRRWPAHNARPCMQPKSYFYFRMLWTLIFLSCRPVYTFRTELSLLEACAGWIEMQSILVHCFNTFKAFVHLLFTV